MFLIKYKITTQREELSHFTVDQLEHDGVIEGFFNISIGSLTYGDYYENCQELEIEGCDLITMWFVQMVRVASNILKHKYVAIKDFETSDWWLEFEHVDNKDIVIRSVVFDGTESIIFNKPKNRIIKDESIEYSSIDDFMTVVASSCQAYLQELFQINPNFAYTKQILFICNWLTKYKIKNM